MIPHKFVPGLDEFDLLDLNGLSKAQAGMTSTLLRRGLIPAELVAAPAQLPVAPRKVAAPQPAPPEPTKATRKA